MTHSRLIFGALSMLFSVCLMAGCADQDPGTIHRDNPADYGCDYGLANGEHKRLPQPGAARACLDDPNCSTTYVIAHRGYTGLGAPANSLQALRDTAAAGIPFAEIDVRTTKDGVMMLSHDADIDVATDGTGKIEDLEWSYIQTLHLKGTDGGTYPVPTFNQAMNTAQKLGLGLYLDIKDVNFEQLVHVIEDHDAQNWALIRASNHERVQKLYDLDPSLWVFTDGNSVEFSTESQKINPNLNLAGLSWDDPLDLIRNLRDAGFKVQADVLALDDMAWVTSKSMSGWIETLRAGAQMLQSDMPVALQRALCLERNGYFDDKLSGE